MTSTIDGIKRELCPSAPERGHAALDRVRCRVHDAANARQRKKVEKDLDVLVHSTPYFRAATRRHFNAELGHALTALKRLLRLMREHRRTLGKVENA
jgi:hypothetical protein